MTAFRVAVLGESATDDAVAREIVAHVRGTPVAPVAVPSLRTRGWSALVGQLPRLVQTVVRRGEADAFIVLADTDTSPVHDPVVHAVTRAASVAECRWCYLHATVLDTMRAIEAGGGPVIPFAVGCPVPSLEAWLLAAQPGGPSEAGWLMDGAGNPARAKAHRLALKRRAYGDATADREPTARSLIGQVLSDPARLRTAFPGGYAPMEDAIRAWPA